MPEPPAAVGRPNFLLLHAQNRPDRLAVVGLERSLTHAQLLERARALARALHARGLRPGDHAAVMTYNLPERAEIGAALGMLRAGVIAIPYQLKPAEIEYIVDNSDSRMLLFWHEFAERILPYKERYPKILPGGFICFGGAARDGAADYESLFTAAPELDLEALPPAENPARTMIYTSGTTGKPKGAARTIDSIASRPGLMEYVFSLLSLLQLNADEVHLICCPLYHSAPWLFSALTFLLGGTRVLQPRFDAEQFFRLVDRLRVTSTHLVPTMVRRLLQVPARFTDALDLGSLRTVVCGAAPLHPRDKMAFLDRFGPILYEYYGSTESGINTVITPVEMRQRPDSVGRALTGNDLIIVDGEGRPVPDGTAGVLYMHNPLMMDGYYRNQEATREVFRGKYLTAGDVAVRDADGYYYIVDRIRDMIIRGGANIYPAEIESCLNSIPGIADSAVVGIPDEEYGESVAAFVVLDKGSDLDAEAIRARCRQAMADNKVPSRILFVDEIPRTPTGKILKRVLRERVSRIAAVLSRGTG